MGLCTTLILLGMIFKGETSPVNMCENGTTSINNGYLELYALGPPLSPLATNISTTCSCLINATHSIRKVYVETLRKTKSKDRICRENKYDEATLDLISGSTLQSMTIQNKELSDYKEELDDLSAIIIGITIRSICGSNYTIRLTKSRSVSGSAKFSHVTCSNPETVITSFSTTTSPTGLKSIEVSANHISSINSASTTAFKPIDALTNYIPSTYSPTKYSTTSTRPKKGSTIGVGVGIGVGFLLLLGAIILTIIMCRRRRTRPQSLTNANHDVPAASPYEPSVEYTSAVYEELRNSTQLQTGILYDNQTATTDLSDTEIYQNYNSLHGIGNDAYHHSDSVPNYDRASEKVDSSVQRPLSIDNVDTTLVENDLYEK